MFRFLEGGPTLDENFPIDSVEGVDNWILLAVVVAIVLYFKFIK